MLDFDINLNIFYVCASSFLFEGLFMLSVGSCLTNVEGNLFDQIFRQLLPSIEYSLFLALTF